MIRLKKNLAVVGLAFIILVLFIFINNSLRNDKTTIDSYNNDVVENIETGDDFDTDIKEYNSKTIENENSFEKDVVIIQNQDEINKDVETEIDKLIRMYYDDEIDKDILLLDKESKADQTVESITKKRELIEEYNNVNTYVKPGLEKDTYIVFSSYDIKLNNINTLVPGMSVLSIIKDETGVLLINHDSNDDNLNDYIKQLTNEDDIKNVINEVNIKLADAIKKDNSLKEFIDYIKDVS